MKMYPYKSWSGLNKELQERLCDSLKGKITYFVTRYRRSHDSIGRACIRFENREIANFSWKETCIQEKDLYEVWIESGNWAPTPQMKEKWDEAATYSDLDFLKAACQYMQLDIKDALSSENYLIRVFAIMDRRVGKRTIEKIKETEEYKRYPDWVRCFYELRIGFEMDSPAVRTGEEGW